MYWAHAVALIKSISRSPPAAVPMLRRLPSEILGSGKTSSPTNPVILSYRLGLPERGEIGVGRTARAPRCKLVEPSWVLLCVKFTIKWG